MCHCLTLYYTHYFIARRQIRCYRTVELCNRGLRSLVGCTACLCRPLQANAAPLDDLLLLNYRCTLLHLLFFSSTVLYLITVHLYCSAQCESSFKCHLYTGFSIQEKWKTVEQRMEEKIRNTDGRWSYDLLS